MSTNQHGSPVAIVTGASRGLGRAVAQALLRNGWTVVVDARDGAALDAAFEPESREERTPELGTREAGMIVTVPGDVTDPLHRATLIERAEAAGPLRLVVANGGTLGPTPLPHLADARLEDLTATFATNATAQLGLAQAALPALRRHHGTLVLVTSDAAVEGYPGWGVYAASKAGLESIGRVLGAEEPDVRVLVVDPGDLRTDMHQAAFPGEDISDRPHPGDVAPGLVRLFEGHLPSGRYQASEVVA